MLLLPWHKTPDKFWCLIVSMTFLSYIGLATIELRTSFKAVREPFQFSTQVLSWKLKDFSMSFPLYIPYCCQEQCHLISQFWNRCCHFSMIAAWSLPVLCYQTSVNLRHVYPIASQRASFSFPSCEIGLRCSKPTLSHHWGLVSWSHF
jgi:hypothetical protein